MTFDEKEAVLFVGVEMDIKESILTEEAEYPKNFASYKKFEFGIAFYFEKSKELHEGNHAILFPEKIKNLESALNEITKFYINKDIEPAIFHPFTPCYFEKNREVIERCGYSLTIYENYRFMILSEKNTISTPRRMEIKRVTDWDERISNDIIIPCGEVWEIESTKANLSNPDNFLFVGYLDGQAVTYTTFHRSVKNNCTRFDYILTAKKYRGHGYARELLDFVVNFCNKNQFQNCFQWAGIPTSERITYEAGFRVAFEAESGHANYIRKFH